MRISYWSSDVCSSDLKYSPDDGRLMERYARRTDQVLQDLFYSYDPMGNVLSIEDKTLPVRYFANQRVEPASRFRYDSLYQVTEATGWEARSEEHTSELQSLMRISYAVFCLKKKNTNNKKEYRNQHDQYTRHR